MNFTEHILMLASAGVSAPFYEASCYSEGRVLSSHHACSVGYTPSHCICHSGDGVTIAESFSKKIWL